MQYLKPIIERIEKLIESGSPADLTYAALECRLAIERICYERLRIVHDYIAHDDLKKWQPKDIVNVLIQEVDPHIASTYTLSIERDPIKEGQSIEAIAKDNEREWVKIGTQIGFDTKLLGSLWNALSSVALHAKLPKSKDEQISEYGDTEKILTKVGECLSELHRLSEGTLMGTGWGEEVSFECLCGRKIKRKADLLSHGQIISCISPECKETHQVTKEEENYFFNLAGIHFPAKSVDTKRRFL